MRDLNGLTPEALLKALEKSFEVEDKGTEIYRPAALHNFSMYLGGHWYSLTARKGTYDDNDPIGVLDVTILSNLVLDELRTFGPTNGSILWAEYVDSAS